MPGTFPRTNAMVCNNKGRAWSPIILSWEGHGIACLLLAQDTIIVQPLKI